MTSLPRASIIITSYNYARFLRAAIDSAVSQTAGDAEIIAVDDGSTDGSTDIIRSYGPRIVPILKGNAGQASAMNAGFAASTGDVVVFLDSDDVLLPEALQNALPLFNEPGVVKVHWPMRVINEQGLAQDEVVPRQMLSDGDVRDAILRDGPEAYEWPPTSGNAWRRSFLQSVLPIPQEEFRVCPDLYLAALVPVAGAIRRIDSPRSLWRAHGQNNTWNEPFQQRLPRFIRQWDLACKALVQHCREASLPVHEPRWRENAWCHRVQRAIDAICQIVPAGRSFILIDQNDWGADERFFDRRCLPFLERDRRYWGLPSDDNSAIAEVERQRSAGAGFVVLAWPCFWCKQHYPGLLRHLRQRYRLRLDNDDLMIYELGESP